MKVFQGGVDEVLNQKQRIEVYADDEEALRLALSEVPQIVSCQKMNLVC